VALARQGIEADVIVYGKNAVMTDYWSVCAQRFGLSTNTSAVLIENHGAMDLTGKRASGGAITGVATLAGDLFQELRRSAPNALLVYVGWPSMGGSSARKDTWDVTTVTANRWRMTVEAEGSFAGALHQLDSEAHIIFASRLLVAAFNTTRSSNATRLRLMDGPVHPGPDGHIALGEATANFLAPRLHMCTRVHSIASNCQARRKASAAAGSAAVAAGAADDECYLTADRLPLAAPLEADVALRDEGGKKGVSKLGLVSTREGTILSLGPVLATVRCGVFVASLGYLQSWRPSQGAFHVACGGGCDCVRYPGGMSIQFPDVSTTLPRSVDGNRRNLHEMAGMSVTAFTRFVLFKRNESPCVLNVRASVQPERRLRWRSLYPFHARNSSRVNTESQVTHAPSRQLLGGKHNQSRIRIDALGLHPADCGFVHVVNRIRSPAKSGMIGTLRSCRAQKLPRTEAAEMRNIVPRGCASLIDRLTGPS
jgi:hypothetical protein